MENKPQVESPQGQPTEQSSQDKLFLIRAEVPASDTLGFTHGFTRNDIILYNQTKKTGVCITSDEEPFVLGENAAKTIEKYMAEGLPKVKSYECSTRFSVGIFKFEYEPVPAEKSASLIQIIEQYINAKTAFDSTLEPLQKSLGDTADSLLKHITSAGLLTKKEKKRIAPPPEELTEEKPFDPTALDQTTKQRLEGIVSGVCFNFAMQAYIFRVLGLKEKAEAYETAAFLGSLTDLSQISNAGESLCYRLKRSQELNLHKDIVFGIALMAYDYALKEKEHERAFELAKDYLKLPKSVLDELQCNMLYDFMAKHHTHRFDPGITFSEAVKQRAMSLPPEKIADAANRAYARLLKEGEHHGRHEDCLRAGLLAKELNLGQEKVLGAGQKIVQLIAEYHRQNPDTIWSEARKLVEEAYKELNLPDATVHPLMLRFFKDMLASRELAEATEFAKHYDLKPEETSLLIQTEYQKAVNHGIFHRAYELRKTWPDIIKDEKIQLGDLEILARI